MKKITHGHVMALPFPTGITIEAQRRVAAHMDDVVGTIDSLRAVQQDDAEELAALFPALRDRVCHGELSSLTR